MRWLFWFTMLAVSIADTLYATSASAQGTDAAATITAQDIARHIGVITDDSMLGRDTPSVGLELTAQYIAGQFQKLGLQFYRQGPLIRRYQIPLRLDFAQSRIVFVAGAAKAVADFSTAAYLGRSVIPTTPMKTSVALVTGIYDSESMHRVKDTLRGRLIFYVMSKAGDSAARARSLALLLGNIHSAGMVVLTEVASTVFDGHLQDAIQRPIVFKVDPGSKRINKYLWMAYVHPDAATGLHNVLAAAGVDLARARADTVPRVVELPSLDIALEPRLQPISSDTATAPNVLGVLEGSDPALKREHVLFVAHMDHVGVSSGKADSINNGANDNASGVAGLLALANAFSQPEARPKRSLIFLAASGGAKGSWGGLWGSDAVASRTNNKALDGKIIPPVTVAAINLDMVGRLSDDSVRISGLRTVTLATPLDWVVRAHPELQLALADGGTLFSPRSDHFPFARRGIPTLSFSTRTHDEAPSADSSLTVDAEQAARVVRFVYYVGQEIANAEQPPRWSAEGLQQLLSN